MGLAPLSNNELFVISTVLVCGIIFSCSLVLSICGLFAVKKLKLEDISYDQQVSAVFANWTFYFNVFLLFFLQQYKFIIFVIIIVFFYMVASHFT